MNSRLLIALAGTAFLAAACGGSTSPSAPTSSPLEETNLTVGIIPIVDVATVQTGLSGGFFEDEGLSVKTEFMQGGAAAIPALVAEELDVAFGAWPSFLIANKEGIELRAIADGSAAREGFTQILAMPDSGLEGNPAGLAGKTVAINTLGNVGELAVKSVVQQAGADPASVTLVAIPFPEMGAALERGDVDAIWISEPGVTSNKDGLGAVVVADSFSGDLAGFPVAGYMVTKAFADANPNTVAAFQRAIVAAAAATADEATARTSIDEYTELSPEIIDAVTLPEYRGALDAEQLQRVYDYMVELGMIDGGLDVESLILPSP